MTQPHPAIITDDDAPLYAARRKIQPASVQGRLRTLKWLVLAFTLGVYYLLPFVRWDRGPHEPSQAVLLDLDKGRFYFFFIELWPQEIYIFAGLLILAAFTLFLMNAVAGRVWCGYLCPQTVWTFVYFSIERFIEGTEVAISVVEDAAGPRSLPVVEISADGGWYDYGARYTAGATEFFVPAHLPEQTLQACATLATTVHTTLGLRDWSRSDVIVDADGTPWFLEVNVAPGMTETSTYPQAVTASGTDLGSLTAALVERALTR